MIKTKSVRGGGLVKYEVILFAIYQSGEGNSLLTVTARGVMLLFECWCEGDGDRLPECMRLGSIRTRNQITVVPESDR